MSSSGGDGPGPGLCGACVHARRVRNRRGSVFLLCELSRRDPRFPRYPRLPVLECPGFRAEVEDAEGRDGGSGGRERMNDEAQEETS